MKPITLYGGLARLTLRKLKATSAWHRLDATRRNARRWRRFCHWEREALKLKDAEDRFWTKHIKAECPDSPTGKHNFTPDWEYDHTGQTINCEYCGEEQPNPERTQRQMETTEVQWIGNRVECDVCSEDYTGRPDTGGFLFGSYAYCPKCAATRLPEIRKYGEEGHIKAHCPQGMPFADWVLSLRNGDHTIRITVFEP